MECAILTINAGSSSLKFGVFHQANDSNLALKKIVKGQVAQLLSSAPKFVLKNEIGEIIEEDILTIGLNQCPYQFAMEHIMKVISKYNKGLDIAITAHRVVHGADEFNETTLIDKSVLKRLEAYIPLAALHQPYNIKIASLLLQQYNGLTHYACFDTVFHQTIDPVKRAYAIPIDYMKKGIKRYGFHGLSYQYITSKLADYVGASLAEGRWIIAHLGSGASLCSVYKQKSIATTLGFSVVAGLPMATRCGDLDPVVVIYLQENFNLSSKEVNDIIHNKSGLLGLSDGISRDIKKLLEINNSKTRFAIDVFCDQVILNIGKMVAAVGGCDGIVFTAGIGENSPEIREMVCNKLTWLNVKIDKEKNEKNEININAVGSVPILVIPTDEEYIMAYEAFKKHGANG